MRKLNVVIPVRGNSSGIKNKNFKKVNTISLIERNIRTLIKSKYINHIIISSEDMRFEKIAKKYNVFFIKRPLKLSNNFIMPDIAVKQALDKFHINYDKTEYSCFTQCTSPFLKTIDLNNGIKKVLEEKYDCLFSSYASHKFIWRYKKDKRSNLFGINHNSNIRLGRQFINHYEVIENGAFYIFKTNKFLKKSHRFFGKIGTYEMPEDRSVDIDSIKDLKYANILAKKFDNE